MWRSVASNGLSFLLVALFLLGALVLWGRNEYTTTGPLEQAICLRVEKGSDMKRVSRDLLSVSAIGAGRRILLPMTLAMVSSDGTVNVKSIRSDQFAQVPGLSNPDQVTLQEEDRITAFYGGGHLYAMPMRSEPLIWV